MRVLESKKIYRDIEDQGYGYLLLDEGLADRLLELGRAFYRFELSKRIELCAARKMGFLGYVPSEREAERAESEGYGLVPVFSDVRKRGYCSFDFVENTEVFSSLAIKIENIWPDDDQFRQEARDLYQIVSGIMRESSRAIVMEIVERAGSCILKPEAFHGGCCSIMRLLRYPQLPSITLSKEHTDYEFLSLILATEPGLQIKGADGGWRTPEARGSVAVLIPGNMFELATDRRVKSAVHRVMYGDIERHSIIFFQGLAYDEPLPKRVPNWAKCFGEHLCGMLIRGSPHMAGAFEQGGLGINFGIPKKNPYNDEASASGR